MTNSVRETDALAPESQSPAYRYRWLILAVVLAAECMDLIDSTVVNVAAPLIAHDFHASTTSLQWIVGGYPLAIAVGLILGGRLGDLVGRKHMFIIGVAGFVLASVLCGIAPDAGVLIASRLLQGLFAALLLPQGFGILREVFPPDEQQQAFAIFGPVIGLSAVLGPIIGGSLINWNLFNSSWRLVFLVNVPIGIVAFFGAIKYLPASRPDRTIKLDLLGTGLVGGFAALLVYPLIQGREDGWPWWTYASMVAGVAMLVVFGVQQRRRERTDRAPLVITSVFGHRGYTAGLVFAVLFFGGMGGVLLCSTLFLQIGQGFSPIKAALATVSLPIGLVIGAGLSGGFLGPKYGRLVIQGGAVVSGGGWLLIILALNGDGRIGFVQLMPGLIAAGIGLGLVVAPMFDTILASVTEEETGSGSGVLNAAQQLAASIGVAVFGTIFFDSIATGNFHHGLRNTLWVQVGVTVVLVLISPLLPRFARAEAIEDGEATGLPASAEAIPAV